MLDYLLKIAAFIFFIAVAYGVYSALEKEILARFKRVVEENKWNLRFLHHKIDYKNLTPPLKKVIVCNVYFTTDWIGKQVKLNSSEKDIIKKELQGPSGDDHCIKIIIEEWNRSIKVVMVTTPKGETVNYRCYYPGPTTSIPETLWRVVFPKQQSYFESQIFNPEELRLEKKGGLKKKLCFVITGRPLNNKNQIERTEHILLEIPLTKDELEIFKESEDYSDPPNLCSYCLDGSEEGIFWGVKYYDYWLFEGTVTELVNIESGKGYAEVNISSYNQGLHSIYLSKRNIRIGKPPLEDLKVDMELLIWPDNQGNYNWIPRVEKTLDEKQEEDEEKEE